MAVKRRIRTTKPEVSKRAVTQPGLSSLRHVLPQIQALIESSRQHVATTANLTLVWLYWNVGRVSTQYIQKNAKHAVYGERLLDAMGVRLTKQYGHSFSARSLWDMRRFFGDFEILPPAVAESTSAPMMQPMAGEVSDRIVIDLVRHIRLGWTHYRILLAVEAIS